MEAPEKIWMNDDWVHQFDDKDFMGEDSVEYTRTDAFIEKSADKFKQLMYDLHFFECMAYQDVIIENLVECFKSYMKGE